MSGPDVDGVGANGIKSDLCPTRFLDRSDANNSTIALIVLNSPIASFDYFERLDDSSCFLVCADGGANRLHDLLTAHFSDRPWDEALGVAPPDIIHGDLDSLDDTVRKRYEQLEVEVSKDPDQYSTDFGKSIKKVIERVRYVETILVLGSLGGRVDQGLGLLGEFYREQKLKHVGVRFWLFSESSISTVLQPGTSFVRTPLSEGLITRNIGILPVYGPAVISTQGLEWDVQDWPTEMGGQVSTSNHIVSDRIAITTDNDVLFTVERATDR